MSGTLRRLALGLATLALAGCFEPPPEVVPSPPPERPTRETPPRVIAPEVAESPGLAPQRRRYASALEPDLGYDDDRRIQAHRIIYRFRAVIPSALGQARAGLQPSATELHLLVTTDRARVTFAGAGWPVEPDSELRLRRDRPGAYVFDGSGGRPIGPGQAAHWFEGGPVKRRPRIWMRHDPARGEDDVGHMVCRFFAEWANSPVDAIVRSCDDGVPRWVRVGPYRGTRTADIIVERARHALRADEVDPPPPIDAWETRYFFAPRRLAQLVPTEGSRPRGGETLSPGPLEIRNGTRARMVITVAGTAIGWANRGESLTVPDLQPGWYWVGGVRPLGALGASGRLVRAPGAVSLPR